MEIKYLKSKSGVTRMDRMRREVARRRVGEKRSMMRVVLRVLKLL